MSATSTNQGNKVPEMCSSADDPCAFGKKDRRILAHIRVAILAMLSCKCFGEQDVVTPTIEKYNLVWISSSKESCRRHPRFPHKGNWILLASETAEKLEKMQWRITLLSVATLSKVKFLGFAVKCRSLLQRPHWPDYKQQPALL